MKITYHDVDRVNCLKDDFKKLDAHDQGMLLVEFGQEQSEEIKKDWKSWVMKAVKWLAAVILSFIVGASAVVAGAWDKISTLF